MSNKIKISTAEFCLEGAFTGTITLPNSEYDFGGFLKVWNTNKSPFDQCIQICKYFFPNFIKKGYLIDNVNWWDDDETRLNQVNQLHKEYFDFLEKVGMKRPILCYSPEENHGWGFINVEDTVSLIVGTIYECLRNKNTALLYDVFLDADSIDEKCLENKFYKVLTF